MKRNILAILSNEGRLCKWEKVGPTLGEKISARERISEITSLSLKTRGEDHNMGIKLLRKARDCVGMPQAQIDGSD